jgi:predicted NodU family carbamoyl transferase
MKSKNLVPWNKGGGPLTEEQLENVRYAARNRNIDPIKQAEGQQKRVAKILGQKRTDETKKLMSLASKGKPKGPMSEEQKQARSITMTGQKKTKSHATNVANAVLGNISINQDDVEKKVKKDVLQSYLDHGWQLGGKKRKTI